MYVSKYSTRRDEKQFPFETEMALAKYGQVLLAVSGVNTEDSFS